MTNADQHPKSSSEKKISEKITKISMLLNLHKTKISFFFFFQTIWLTVLTLTEFYQLFINFFREEKSIKHCFLSKIATFWYFKDCLIFGFNVSIFT